MRETMGGRPARIVGAWTPVRARAETGTDPIDREHLGRYTLGDSRLEREVLGLFAAHLPLAIESLRFADDDRAWHMAAHTIKGSARAVGAWKIAEIAVEAERRGGVADAAACRELLERLDQAATEIDSYMSAGMGRA